MSIILLALLQAATVPADRRLNLRPLVHTVRPTSSKIRGEYQCLAGVSIQFDASGSGGQVKVRNLRLNGRIATAEQYAKMDDWLGRLKLLSSVDVDCVDDGAKITIKGQEDPHAFIVSEVSFSWTSKYFGPYP